ncbi:glutathione S-transferase family protein [Cypionkella sp.]|uniref:glutathione S-transferase family protein n=1 Tax=Cypionkella sp. TaxID=2811411 RepID=UPI002717F408|nr:glutathione binding-like protein [Cypionkella sp.]MDO8984037.1 glutathione binding-like protein [Cypionkella sp.]MDP1577913.1 glutathione binding-like protein [Cypionkella sp.]MDP2049238.1 glutathione binding-like protein [Cypionkella sp.]
MLTLFHAPQSRSSAIVTLLDEMGITDKVEIRPVAILRMDGSGGVDPSNPHPEGKAPALLHDGHLITERGAIMLHLTTLFPDAGLAPPVGAPLWGEYLTWLSWYQGVLEPVLVMGALGLDHPGIARTFRGHPEAAARINAALQKGPWLLGETFSAADLLVHSPYAWFKDVTPDDPLIRDWVARCMARPARLRVLAADEAAMAKVA